MAYQKNTWEDRQVQYPNRYTDQNGNVYTFTRNPGEVTKEGSIPTAAKMNNMENGIEDVDSRLEDIEDKNPIYFTEEEEWEE